jgi:type I restriction enzyme S subunit
MSNDWFFEKFALIADAPGAVERMRGLVLELAVQGRVVEQDNSEGSSLVLLKEIRKKNIASNEEISMEQVEFQSVTVPSSWEICGLGEVAEIVRGVTFPGSAKSDSPRDGYVACLRTASIQSEIDWEDLIYIPQSHVRRMDQWVAPNDILISMANSYELVGKVAIVRSCPKKASFGAFLAAIRPILVDPYYLLYVLRSPRMQFSFRASSSQTTNIANISLGRMRPLPFPLPPLAEQKRIVAKVDELMGLCDALEAQQQERELRKSVLVRSSLSRFAEAPTPENLGYLFHKSYDIPPSELRKSILTLAVQGKLVPQDPNDEPAEKEVAAARREKGLPMATVPSEQLSDELFEAPTSWCWVKVNDVAENRLGKMLDEEKNSGTPQPYLRNTNVHWFHFDLKSIKTILMQPQEVDEFRLARGDVMICEGGHGIARTAVWENQIPGVVFQKALHRVRPFECLNPYFFAFCIRVYEVQGILGKYYTGAGIPHFTGRSLAKLVFPLPPLAEQHRIVAKVDQLMALVDELERQQEASRENASNLLDAIVHEMTSGG